MANPAPNDATNGAVNAATTSFQRLPRYTFILPGQFIYDQVEFLLYHKWLLLPHNGLRTLPDYLNHLFDQRVLPRLTLDAVAALGDEVAEEMTGEQKMRFERVAMAFVTIHYCGGMEEYKDALEEIRQMYRAEHYVL